MQNYYKPGGVFDNVSRLYRGTLTSGLQSKADTGSTPGADPAEAFMLISNNIIHQTIADDLAVSK